MGLRFVNSILYFEVDWCKLTTNTAFAEPPYQWLPSIDQCVTVHFTEFETNTRTYSYITDVLQRKVDIDMSPALSRRESKVEMGKESNFKRLCDSLKQSEDRQKITSIIRTHPDVLLESNKDANYKGQTALHMVICKENIDLIERVLMLRPAENANMLQQSATGKKFKKTSMMGELPLIVAALTLNLGMFIS